MVSSSNKRTNKQKERGTRMCTPALVWLHENRMGEDYIVEDNRRTSSGIIGMIGRGWLYACCIIPDRNSGFAFRLPWTRIIQSSHSLAISIRTLPITAADAINP